MEKNNKIDNNDCMLAVCEYYELNCNATSSLGYDNCVKNFKIINSIPCQQFYENEYQRRKSRFEYDPHKDRFDRR